MRKESLRIFPWVITAFQGDGKLGTQIEEYYDKVWRILG